MGNLKSTYRLVLLLSVLLFSFGTTTLYGQTHNLRIQITDTSLNPLSNSTVGIDGQYFLSDSAGSFIQKVKKGKHIISVSSIGFHIYHSDLHIISDTLLSIALATKGEALKTISIVAGKNRTNEPGSNILNAEQLRKLPVILGEADPLKTITLLPGIKNGGEAGNNIYVRGGGPDQNLVLLDDMPVYNPNHLFGFFSIFNGDVIDKVMVKKGDLPPSYGGRLSSVVSIDTRDGDKDSLKLSGGIGLISSKLTLEGPLIRNKASFILSGRRTYIDQLARVFARKKIGGNGYYFYDINAKSNYVINENNRLQLTMYTGHDAFRFYDSRKNLYTVNWGNNLAGLSWHQSIKPQKLKQSVSFIYSAFQGDSYYSYGLSQYLFTSGIRDYQFKNDWNYHPTRRLKMQWGMQLIRHRFSPGAGDADKEDTNFRLHPNHQYATETAFYLNTEYKITKRLQAGAGLRYSLFRKSETLSNPASMTTDETMKSSDLDMEKQPSVLYQAPEPRLHLEYALSGTSGIVLSYTSTMQYIHLATTSGASFPSDLWLPSGEKIQPGMARQIGLSYFRKTWDAKYNLSLEGYYKQLGNQTEFRTGTQVLFNDQIENEIILGKGKAYGIEFLSEKKKGKLTGWLGYTISKSERTFVELNNGKPFPYRYDRTHDLSVTANYEVGRRWNFSTVFVFATGNAMTIPTGRVNYNIGYNISQRTASYTSMNQYNEINNYRMPSYHRLDLAATYSPVPKRTGKFRQQWVFTVYNVYNRRNPYFIYVDINQKEKSLQGKLVYLFPITPSVGWNFKF